MQEFLFDEFDEMCSLSTIWRVLTAQRWNRKVAMKRAAERDEHLRNAFRLRQYEYPEALFQVMCVDESAANRRTGDRKRGWSPIGIDPVDTKPLKRGSRWNIIPAYTADGYLGNPLVFIGSTTREVFETWIAEDVLPFAGHDRTPVLVMDNASIHKGDTLLELCIEGGVVLTFLPPYSPDMNPIEFVFHDLKMWIRRNAELANDFEDYGDFLLWAISQADDPAAARGHFRNCGWYCE